MPLPKPRQGENRSEFISRCVRDENVQNEASDSDQALAMCFSIWEQNQEKHSMNDQLLNAIKDRSQKRTEFGYGILTADKYVRTMKEHVGIDACYKFAATRQTSFDDVLRKSANTLVYSNPEMVVEQKGVQIPEDEMPKNTLMMFRHVLTTPRKDRDGDVLRTQGATIDSSMLLLWQHVHTLPIGKLIRTVEHNSDRLTVVSAIVDMNELCHDAAVMVDNGMGRFSHGFRALEFSELKEQEGETTSPGGFDVKRFEIMEESLVSVPSNVDAETEEVILGLVESGKLTSGIMKEYGKTIRDHRPATVQVGDWTVTTTLEGMKHEDESRDGSPEAEAAGSRERAAADSPEETHEDPFEEAEAADYAEIKMLVGQTGESEGHRHVARVDKQGNGSTSSDKGHRHKIKEFEVLESSGHTHKLDKRALKFEDVLEEKAGRSLSRANYKKLQNVQADLSELMDKESLSRGGNAMCERCVKTLGEVLKASGHEEEEDGKDANTREVGVVLEDREVSVREAMGIFLSRAGAQERATMLKLLKAIDENERLRRFGQQYRALMGSN